MYQSLGMHQPLLAPGVLLAMYRIPFPANVEQGRKSPNDNKRESIELIVADDRALRTQKQT